jgi:hypothetical protein
LVHAAIDVGELDLKVIDGRGERHGGGLYLDLGV